jgi:ABC-2 type transport system permease protein
VIALVLVWYVLGYALYSMVFAVTGAVAARVEELQSTATPVYMLVIGAFFIAQSVAFTPGSTLALAAGLFPFTAPRVQPLRTAAGAAQPWEVTTPVVLTIATVALLVPLAARLYSGGVFRLDRKLRLRDAWRAGRG